MERNFLTVHLPVTTFKTLCVTCDYSPCFESSSGFWVMNSLKAHSGGNQVSKINLKELMEIKVW